MGYYHEEPNACGCCGSTNLRAMSNSDTLDYWVSCDGCGRIGTPANTPEECAENWDREQ